MRNIRITGPTPLHPKVLKALSQQVQSHRSMPFRESINNLIKLLKPIFGTKQLPMLFSASGTGGLEASIVNIIQPRQNVLAIKIGYFGGRYAEIAKVFGADVKLWDIPWGQGIDVSELRKKIRSFKKLDAVLLTHNETSTGVINPLQAIAKVINEESNALILVDGISSVGATYIEMEKWSIDVVVTASQKALMAPAGLTIITASDRALEIARENIKSNYYFNFNKMQTAVKEGMTTYTPALPSLFGLCKAVQLFHEEGLINVYKRHKVLSKKCRDGLVELGLKLFAVEGYASPTVTSILMPEKYPASLIREKLETEHNVFVAQGRAKLKERLLRIGHMGWVNENDIDNLLTSFKKALS